MRLFFIGFTACSFAGRLALHTRLPLSACAHGEISNKPNTTDGNRFVAFDKFILLLSFLSNYYFLYVSVAVAVNLNYIYTLSSYVQLKASALGLTFGNHCSRC